MAVKSILKLGDPLSRDKCHPVNDSNAKNHVIADLIDTLESVKSLYEFPRGSGLAAPQIGHQDRITIIEYNNKRYILINPEIINASKEKIKIREGCLSFFDYRGEVERYKKVKVKALDENGYEYEIEGSDDFTSLLQHEIDHLDGILLIDRLPNGKNDLKKIEGMPKIP